MSKEESAQLTLPPEFLNYLKVHDIDPRIYEIEPPKYFYLIDKSKSETDLAADLNIDASEIINKSTFCPGFYQIPSSVSFSSSKLYQNGGLLPMDVTSGMAVELLELQAADQVLDLCCAPGGKLVLAGLKIKALEPSDESNISLGAVTGVDLAEHRLANCRALVKKYRLPKARLFLADGRKFDERPWEILERPVSTEKCVTSSTGKLFHETTVYRKRPVNKDTTYIFYDKVIVDAQCTHDGSIKHIRKHFIGNESRLDLDQFSGEALSQLYQLQYDLLANGFRLLKPGGTLIYSTCSLSRKQNEEIIERFLANHKGIVEPFPFRPPNSSENVFHWRCHPREFDGSGFFICRLRKLE